MNKILKYEHFLIVESNDWIDLLIVESNFNINSFFRKILTKVKNLSKEKKRKILLYALTTILAFTNASDVLNVINSDDYIKSEINQTPEILDLIKEKVNLWEDEFEIPSNLKWEDPTNLRLSKEGWKHLKNSEGKSNSSGKPVLKAYELGDDMITVGWGHAEPISSSNLSKGEIISLEKAQKLLEEDAKKAADGVRRIFRDWKKEGVIRTLTQNQFDALVSMAFNMGVSGLRSSDVISAIKEGNYIKAGNLIKKTGISKKFEKGHSKRREKESNMFLKWMKK